jgi:hypothetical protein
MAIAPEQQATLQLLLERGQSYADLAQLLGQDEAEVRARARAALTELGGADPDRNVGLTDYLLGQADPIGRADASRHLREDPADHQLATDLSETLRAMFPAAELPRLPGEPRTGGLLGRSRRPARPSAEEDAAPRKSPFSGLSGSQTRMIVIAASAGVLLLAVVLAVAGVFGGGGGDSTAATDTSTTAAADEQIQRVALRPVSGGDAKGEATFGLATGDQPFVDISIDGLDPAPSGQTYVIWLMITDTQGYPLSPITVSDSGSFQDRFSIPSAVLPLVARVQFVDVSIAPVKAIRKLVRDAIQQTALVLEEPGDVVLRGEIPKAADQQGSGGQGSGGQGSGG